MVDDPPQWRNETTVYARVDYLRKFGSVPDWLQQKLGEFTFEQWRRFVDSVEESGRLPKTFRETMPRDHDDMICSPASQPPRYQAESQAAWDSWSLIWGEPPWRQAQKSVKPALPPKFKD